MTTLFWQNGGADYRKEKRFYLLEKEITSALYNNLRRDEKKRLIMSDMNNKFKRIDFPQVDFESQFDYETYVDRNGQFIVSNERHAPFALTGFQISMMTRMGKDEINCEDLSRLREKCKNLVSQEIYSSHSILAQHFVANIDNSRFNLEFDEVSVNPHNKHEVMR